ncbi:MAG: OB-fold nucleic acid binding domain-containing protein [Lentisphaerae bacterium]|nr:OB-fold nucleic acid binding domain-containing protein [Lentisphaerota bacterium]
MSVRNPLYTFLRRSSFVFGICGVLILYAVSLQGDRHIIAIGEIGPTYNFSHIHVRGRVERRPYVANTRYGADRVSFYIDDGTGRIKVVAYGDVATALCHENRIPQKGMLVDARGVLVVSRGRTQEIRLHVPDGLSIETTGEGTDASE